MAKYKNDTNTTGKAVAVIAVLVALLMIAYVTLSLVFHSWNPAKWTEVEQGQVIPPIGDEDDKEDNNTTVERGLLIAPDKVTFGLMRLAVEPTANNAIEAYSEDSQTVRVLNPHDEYLYTWSLPSSASAYINLSATTGTSVEVTAKQSFSQQITLTCTATLEGSPTSTAKCTLDYLKRPTGVWFGGSNGSYRSDGSTYDFGTAMGVDGIENAIKNGKLNFSVPSSKSVIQFGEGTVDFGTTYYTMKITESTSGLSWQIADYVPGHAVLPAEISFSELYFRYARAADGSGFDQTQYNSYLIGLDYRSGPAFNLECNALSGKTFNVVVNVINTDHTERNTSITYKFTMPTSWAVPYSVNITDNIIL